jgi:hypothetical protein
MSLPPEQGKDWEVTTNLDVIRAMAQKFGHWDDVRGNGTLWRRGSRYEVLINYADDGVTFTSAFVGPTLLGRQDLIGVRDAFIWGSAP